MTKTKKCKEFSRRRAQQQYAAGARNMAGILLQIIGSVPQDTLKSMLEYAVTELDKRIKAGEVGKGKNEKLLESILGGTLPDDTNSAIRAQEDRTGT